ncbi:GIY-YIG nuclease family protein [Bradyrhizobium australiense]|uniref:GIY-YIG nuclease family protein n=1 Tax=Bradyrhizobium australiense TaxID=2721161 RepID=A0A7Y4LU99_9BRAD|nr:GIY-YIG nuclease family protein [Bradyrhizobium australiense]NOJ38789.1 GIY-YIG nuclease family protein [Bradyrhizobium australiense]
MHYVYLLQSECYSDQRYVGMASDVQRRLSDHNAANFPIRRNFCRGRPVTYVAFSNEQKARTSERYLKSGSGHAFARKRLW